MLKAGVTSETKIMTETILKSVTKLFRARFAVNLIPKTKLAHLTALTGYCAYNSHLQFNSLYFPK